MMIIDEGGSSDRENFSFDFSFFSHIQWKSFRTSYNIANNNESKLTTSALYIYIFYYILCILKSFIYFIIMTKMKRLF